MANNNVAAPNGLDAQGNGPSWGGNPFEGLIKLLQSVPNQNSTTQGGMSVASNSTQSDNNQQPQLPPAHQAAVDGAIQGIKKAASEAATAGGLPAANHIIDTATSSSPQPQGQQVQQPQIDPNKIAILQQLITSGHSQGSIQQPQKSVDNNFNYQPNGPIDKFFNMLGFTPTPDNQLLLAQAQATRQRVAAGQPADIAVPQAQAAELNQRIQGAEPIQPKDIADLNRQTYSATIQAANDAWQRNTDEIKTMQEQFKTLQEGRNGLDKTMGKTTPEMQKMQKLIIAKMKQNQQHLSNLQTIFNNPPKAENQSPANSPFQVGQQYNGETIKNVKRIK